jgi:hypothetical protein
MGSGRLVISPSNHQGRSAVLRWISGHARITSWVDEQQGRHIDMIEKEKMYASLSLISKGVTRPTAIAKAIGTSYRNYRNWLVRSNRGDPLFLIDFDGEEIQWAKAITLSTRLALFELRGMVTQKSIFGTNEPAMKDGQYVWALDPAAVPLDRETRELLGYHPDALLLDAEGRAQPVMIHTDAPIALQLRLLEAAFPDLRPSQTVNNNVAVSGAVGVAFARPVDYSKPPTVPPPPPMPALEAPITDADFSEVDDLDDLLWPTPVAAAPININIGVTLPDAGPEINVPVDRTIRDTPTAAETPPPQTGILKIDEPPRRPARSALEQSLYDALADAKARKAQS